MARHLAALKPMDATVEHFRPQWAFAGDQLRDRVELRADKWRSEMSAKRKSLQHEVAEVMAIPTEPAAPPSNGCVVTAEDLAADAAFLDDEAPKQPLGDDAAGVPEAAATEEPADGTGPARGSINAMVKGLLADPDLSYGAIVDRVMAAHPDARTTARSVASTASVMRRKGETVPMRRTKG